MPGVCALAALLAGIAVAAPSAAQMPEEPGTGQRAFSGSAMFIDENAGQLAPVAAAALTLDAVRSGEGVGGFPSWEERVIHAWINRARSDPQFEMAACGDRCPDRACYTPVPPLSWSEALNRAARFHAAEMQKQGYFGHDSKCSVAGNINALYPVGCDGSASCACVGGAVGCGINGCTPWTARVGLFGTSTFGEIIASPGEPNGAFYMWLFESTNSPACQFTQQNGHRWNMLSSRGDAVGVGVTSVAVADFGAATELPGKIPSGTHYPGQSATVEVWANWYDSSPPRSASVIIDGKCQPMTLKRGNGTNGAWSATVTGAGSGCHRYFFSFVDSTGAVVTYPRTGSLGIGPCDDWNSTRTEGTCAATTAPRRWRAARRR